MRYLLDTNVISELGRSNRNAGVTAWWSSVDPERVHLSVITLGELRMGIERIRPREGPRAADFDLWLAGLEQTFANRVEHVDAEIAHRWGRLRAAPRRPPIDTLLAATALVRSWTLVTRNVRDVEQTGCLILNPFT